jgi:hypothetical protein
MTRSNLFVAATILALTLAGYFLFPGHTYLQADTQIYLPILERYWDPSVFSKEILARRPHVSFTIYDETALWLRKLTGLDFRVVLTLQQLLFRALGILGVYLVGTSFRLSTKMALLVASVYALGATVLGPTVLTVEYEPVPRGFAVPLLLLALGFVAHGRDIAAGIAASAAFLYHPPTVYTFWIVYFCLTLRPTRPSIMSLRIEGLLPLLGAVLVLFFFSRLQPGVAEAPQFLGRIDPMIEKLQRWRAPYNWVSLWLPKCYWHYALLWVITAIAYLRVRKHASEDLKFMLVGLPLLGVASVPLSFLLLEKLKWIMVPQWQPARAVLFITVLAAVLAVVAGVRAVQQKRLVEGCLWLVIGFSIPASSYAQDVLFPNLADPLIRRRAAVVLIVAAAAALAAWAEARAARWATGSWAAAIALPLLLLPGFGKISNYPRLESPGLRELARWARSSTPKDAVFLFPDAGRSFEPGYFRAVALRAVYVDWKSGGQVNFLPRFGEEWWRRWQATMAGRKRPPTPEEYAALGIDYVVARPGSHAEGLRPVFSNSRYTLSRVAR